MGRLKRYIKASREKAVLPCRTTIWCYPATTYQDPAAFTASLRRKSATLGLALDKTLTSQSSSWQPEPALPQIHRHHAVAATDKRAFAPLTCQDNLLQYCETDCPTPQRLKQPMY